VHEITDDSRLIQRLLLIGLLAGASIDAASHVTSTGLASVTVDGPRLDWRLSLSLENLPPDVRRLVERARSGERASADRTADLLRGHLGAIADGEPCQPGPVQVQGPADRATLRIEFNCRAAPRRLELTDALSDVFGEHYLTLLSVKGPGGAQAERALQKGAPAVFDFSKASPSGWGALFALGIEHIVTGWDHLLFLAALLVGVTGVWRVLAIVTAFTVAHSATLALAVLKIVEIPPAIIEPAIAASIVWVALENVLAPRALARRWAVSLAFGLLHGLGFAGALAEVQLSGWPLAVALLAFNGGVELGQAAVVLLLVPAFAWLARQPRASAYARVVSSALAVAGAAWLIERVLA